MIKSLVGKELAEHWASMALIALFMCIGFLVALSREMFASDGSRPYEALQFFLITFVIVSAMILGNRLVVREYQGKTQLFLEALPLSRLGMITTKYLFGLLIILLPTLLMFGLVTLLSLRIDDLSGQFMAIVLSKTVLFAMSMYSFFFLMGLMGRYRVAIYILMTILAVVLSQFTKIEFDRFGPFALIDSRFAYERLVFPTSEVIVTALLIGACLVVIGLLTVTREGNVAAMLAEKMSYREKIFVTCLVFCIAACLMIFEEQVFKVPFDLPDALVASANVTEVKISNPGKEKQQKAQSIANSVAAEVSELVKFLSIEKLPPIFLVQRSDLDSNQYERGVLKNADGILIRANFQHADWLEQDFLSWFAGELIVATSEERTLAEPVRWVQDGFSFYWAQRQGYSHNNADTSKRDARVAYAMSLGFDKNDYHKWLTYRERVGDDIAEAMAWNGLETIRSIKGDEATRKFISRVLDPDVAADIRASIHAFTNSVGQVQARNCDWTNLRSFKTGSIRLPKR